MSKTNVYVLIATALLGVLLIVVQQIGGDADVVPLEVPTPEAAEAEKDSDSPGALPVEARPGRPAPVRLDSSDDLKALLDARGLNGASLLESSADWFRKRGFNGPQPLLGVTAGETPEDYFSRLDDDTLRGLSDAGDAGATLSLGMRIALTDAFAALELFEKAVEQGSSAALLQIASQRETLSYISMNDFDTDPEFTQKLRRLGYNSPDRLVADAFVYASIAIRDSGEPVVDEALIDWLDSLNSRLSDARRLVVCERSFGQYVNMGMQRRKFGLPPVNFEVPPVFLALPDLEERLPCNDTNSPIASTLDLSACSVEPVFDDIGRERLLYVCAQP